MRYSAVAALMILTTVLLSACAQDHMAMLDDRSGTYHGRAPLMMTSDGSKPLFVPNFQMTTETAAALDSVSSQELAPPPTAAPAPALHPLPATTAAGEPHSQLMSDRHAVAWQWPVPGTVTAGFGKQREGIANEGVTIAAAAGTPIHAAAGGEVAFVGSQLRDYGNMVILRHPNGDMSSYAHAQRITVAKGMTVKQGDVIGYVGQSGRAKSPQLHFAIRAGNRAVDPLSKLPSQLASR